MKKTSKILLTVIVVVLLGIGVSTFFKVNGSIGNDKIQLRLAHGQAGDSEIGGTIAYLSDLVAEDESMNMEVSIYPSGVLGSETAMVELVQAGVLDMAKISANTLGQFDDRYTIFSLPYLFKGQEHYYNAMANSQVIRELFNATEDAGYIAIGYYCNGARNFYLKDDVAVTSPAVLKGKKIRSMVSSTSMDMIEAMGGSPVPMSASETYTSLQQGIVDGAENTELALTVDKHEEIVKSYTYTEHQYTPDIYIISTKVWNKLSKEQQDYLLECFSKLNDNFVQKYNQMMHIKYLYDTHTGLFFHGWSFNRMDNFGGVFWCRGNSWFTLGILDYLDMFKGTLNQGVKTFILDTYKAQVRALRDLQGEDGLWHTVLDDSTSYEETSGSAAITAGILKGIRMGILDDSYLPCAKKAIRAILKNIDTDGTVLKVSGGTGMGYDRDHYKNILIAPMAYGQSLTILALVEALETFE